MSLVSIAACTGATAEAPQPPLTEALPTQERPTTACSECETLQTIDDLRKWIPYAEAKVSAYMLEGSTDLTIWFVEPDLDSNSITSEVVRNAELANRRIADLAQRLNAQNPCIALLYGGINLIVVDTDYNAWSIVGVTPLELSDAGGELDPEELEGIFHAGSFDLNHPFNLTPARATSRIAPGRKSGMRWMN